MNPDKRRARAKARSQEGRVAREYRKLKRRKTLDKLIARPDVKNARLIKGKNYEPDRYVIDMFPVKGTKLKIEEEANGKEEVRQTSREESEASNDRNEGGQTPLGLEDRESSDEPEASDCDRALGSEEDGRESTFQEKEVLI